MDRVCLPVCNLIPINHDTAGVMPGLSQRPMNGDAHRAVGNRIAGKQGGELAVLGHLLRQRNGGQDVDAKLFVAVERIVRDGQRLPVGRRSERTRKQQAAPFTVFNRVA